MWHPSMLDRQQFLSSRQCFLSRDIDDQNPIRTQVTSDVVHIAVFWETVPTGEASGNVSMLVRALFMASLDDDIPVPMTHSDFFGEEVVAVNTSFELLLVASDVGLEVPNLMLQSSGGTAQISHCPVHRHHHATASAEGHHALHHGIHHGHRHPLKVPVPSGGGVEEEVVVWNERHVFFVFARKRR